MRRARSGRCVELLYPDSETFRRVTLGIALAWCPVYPMIDELGTGTFAP